MPSEVDILTRIAENGASITTILVFLAFMYSKLSSLSKRVDSQNKAIDNLSNKIEVLTKMVYKIDGKMEEIEKYCCNRHNTRSCGNSVSNDEHRNSNDNTIRDISADRNRKVF